MQRNLSRMMLSLFACLLLEAPTARADDTYVAPVHEAWREALVQYSEGRHAEAFANFFWAAIRDHAQAQEIVGMMYLLGPEFYGPGVRRDPQEAAFWLSEAGGRGRETARYMRCLMDPAGAREGSLRRVVRFACADTGGPAR